MHSRKKKGSISTIAKGDTTKKKWKRSEPAKPLRAKREIYDIVKLFRQREEQIQQPNAKKKRLRKGSKGAPTNTTKQPAKKPKRLGGEKKRRMKISISKGIKKVEDQVRDLYSSQRSHTKKTLADEKKKRSRPKKGP